ncbi:MAG: putative phage abortive infection protein [Pontixanthobacter sp.]
MTGKISKSDDNLNLPKTPASGPLFASGLWVLLAIASITTVGVIGVGYYNSAEFSALGAWGDFTGGLLNPILTFITFLALILTLWLQRQELSLTRDEMVRSANALDRQANTLKHQSFEKTFFEMLSLHNAIVEAIDLVNPDNGNVTKGRDAFNVFYNRFTKIFRDKVETNKENGGGYSELETAQLAYFLFWKDAKTELSHYFRFLYNFFRFIEQSEVDDEFYPKLLRSQISDQELLVLFYNNISEQGNSFAKYADIYELFDNLPVERLLSKDHAGFASKKAYGNNAMDFHPRLGLP